MAMAMEDSVTVSMGDEMRGVFRVIFLVNADVRSSNLDLEGEQDKNYDLKRTIIPLKLKILASILALT